MLQQDGYFPDCDIEEGGGWEGGGGGEAKEELQHLTNCIVAGSVKYCDIYGVNSIFEKQRPNWTNNNSSSARGKIDRATLSGFGVIKKTHEKIIVSPPEAVQQM